MKRHLASFLLLGALLLGAVGCTGKTARSKALDPALRAATPTLVTEASNSPATTAEEKVVLEKYQQTVDAGDWAGALTLWPQVRQVAEKAIRAEVAAGRLGFMGAQSLTERLNQYETQLKLQNGVQ
jgi:hypothetical protein